MNRPPTPTPRAVEIARLYRAFLEEPESSPSEWRQLFRRLDEDARGWLEALSRPPTPAPELVGEGGERAARDALRAYSLIDAYRTRGHLAARLDPLELAPREPQADLDPETHGFSEADLDRPILLAGELGLESATPRQILDILRRDYCGTLGVEFMHVEDPNERGWIQEHVEAAPHRAVVKNEWKRQILERLTAAETFESFLHKKYQGTKRFGLDGGESLMPALEMIVRRATEVGVEDIVIGMSHRGRLNVLANLMGKPLEQIFAEFEGGSSLPDDFHGAGDVKYHLGTSTDRVIEGRKVHLSLTPNPSHLEAVDPVVVGRVRARQDQMGDREHVRSLGLLLHGDAAFAGQGLVPETLQFCELSGYRVGGVIHVVINNQIGFTTSPVTGRSSPYCSDVAKMCGAPILHVNCDDPEMVVRAAGFAVAYRHAFRKDVVLDLYCYRRFGHNEGDEPAFTQPKMYAAISRHESTRALYAKRLVAEGVVTPEEVESLAAHFEKRYDEAFEASAHYEAKELDWLEGSWTGFEPVRSFDARRGHTGVPVEVLREIGRAITHVPEGFAIHRRVERQLRRKREILERGAGVDWATAETLAFGGLVLEGTRVRLSGEDCSRGTFSQRHAAWIDQETEERYVPLDHVREQQARFEVIDSPLSEFGVLGFEYGYSLSAPHVLVLWEAQFGDFANGAQIIFDQFLAAGEEKWLRMSGLVILLPHGFEGQGPEHSSARLERWLQLCAEDNLQVVNCTTPANYFHALRRQIHRPFRKPLIVMSPKSLLRHKRVVSKLEDMGPGSGFHRVLHCDELPSEPAEARQVVLCSGKVYYDLLEEREKRGTRDVHFLRLEQLYPFPDDALREALEPYRHCRLVWCQEEPRNMGAFEYAGDLVLEVARDAGCEHLDLRYAGRETSASPATGRLRDHLAEQAQLVDEALTVGLEPRGRLAYRKWRSARPPGSRSSASGTSDTET